MSQQTPPPLQNLLSTTLILRQTAPYLPTATLLALSATSKAFQTLITTQAEAWRYLDLSKAKSALIDTSPIDSGGISWRHERMDEALTEDDFYSGPLRGIFSKLERKGVLRFVHTLVLDGLSVPADLVREIIAEDRFNVKVLSLRDCKNLNHSKLQQVLRYAVRPGRAEDSIRLRGLYIFGRKDATATAAPLSPPGNATHQPPTGVLASEGAQIGSEWTSHSSATLNKSLPIDDQQRWYASSGRVLIRPKSDWAYTISECKGIITFDAVLCRGPRHDISLTTGKEYLEPALASVALGPQGCQSCGSCPEGPAIFGKLAQETLPLLAPPPTHSSTIRAAQMPEVGEASGFPPFFARCEDCLRGRWCERCNRWWCEECYQEPVPRSVSSLQASNLGPATAASTTTPAPGAAIKVYTKLCVEHCLVGEMMMSADGFWG